MRAAPLQVGVADLLERPGTRRKVQRSLPLPGIQTSSASVPEGAEVVLDVELEAIGGGLVADGFVEVPWTGTCRRCLEQVDGTTRADVREVFERRPVEGETYALAGDVVDLEPMLRDAAMLALPLAPLCRPDCAGPAPETFPTAPAVDAAPAPDPRWAALDELRSELSED